VNLLSLMDLPQIIIQEIFLNLPPGKLSISSKIVHVLSHFRFDSEGGTILSKNINDFLVFYKSLEVNNEYVMCILFTLTLDGHVNQWCHSLPSTSVHSFCQFLKELH